MRDLCVTWVRLVLVRVRGTYRVCMCKTSCENQPYSPPPSLLPLGRKAHLLRALRMLGHHVIVKAKAVLEQFVAELALHLDILWNVVRGAQRLQV